MIESILKKTGDYLETRMDIVRLKTIDKSSEIVSTALSELVLIFFISLAVLILSIGVAILIGAEIGKPYLGFLIVGGFYAIICALLFVFRKEWLKRYFQNLMLKKIIDR